MDTYTYGKDKGKRNITEKEHICDTMKDLRKEQEREHVTGTKRTKKRNMINEKAKEKGSGKDKKQDMKKRKSTSDKEREKGNRKWQIK